MSLTTKTEGPAAAGAAAAALDHAHSRSRPDAEVFRRILTIVAIGFFIQTIVTDQGGLAQLPVKLLLKNHLHVDATAVASFTFLTGVAWYLKPVFGVVVDTLTIRGTRYRNYLLLSSFGSAAVWFLMGIIPRVWTPLLLTWTIGNLTLAVLSTVLGGYLVTEGRRYNATGRLGAFRNNAMYATGIIAGPVGGWLAGRDFGLTGAVCGILLVLLGVYLIFTFVEPPRPPSAVTEEFGIHAAWRKLKEQYAPLVRSTSFWIAAAMTFFVMCVPGFGTPILYYQQNTLHFSDQFLGTIAMAQGITGILGGFVYMVFCKRFSLRWMLGAGIIVNTASLLAYVLYRPYGTLGTTETISLVIDSLAGLLQMIPIIALLDLAARATPTGGESLAYALLMSVYNFGVRMSDMGGSWLHDKFNLDIHTLVLVSAATTLVTLIAVPFLPHSLVGTPDGVAVERAGEVQGEETPMVAEESQQPWAL